MAYESARQLVDLVGSNDVESLEAIEHHLERAGITPLDPEFGQHLARMMKPDRAVAETLAELHLPDLQVAWRCTQGDTTALAELDARIADVVPALRSHGPSPDDIDEICQAVRVHLLVSPSGAPRLLQYSGRGRLGGFVRVVAVRILLAERRTDARASVVDQLQHVVVTSHDPELERIKRDSMDEFRAALVHAFENLPSDKKVLLRHQIVDQLSIDQVGALYRIHRSTAARRMASARDTLVRETRLDLARRLGLTRFEISSVMRLIESRLGDAADALPSQ